MVTSPLRLQLDRRGNWLDFREWHRLGHSEELERLETRTASDVNAYTAIDPDAPLPDENDETRPSLPSQQ